MTSDVRPPLSATLIQRMGHDPGPAAALGSASGLAAQPYDAAGLGAALAQGQVCVVVWSDPADAIAHALRADVAPSVAAAAWCCDGQDLLRLFTRNRRKLLLVADRLIAQADPADLARLGLRLQLPFAMTPPAAPVIDLPAMLARVTAASLTDLRPVWDELQASSLTPLEENYSSADLDPIAHVLAHQQQSAQRHTAEVALQRATMADLLRELTETAEALTAAQAGLAIDQDRLTCQATESQLLREQIGDLTSLFSANALAHAAELQQTRLDQKAEQAAMQPGHDRTRTELDLVRTQLVALSDTLDNAASMTEVTLLREQLVDVTALLQAVPDGIGPAHVQIEAAFAKLLSALATETDLRRKAQHDAMIAKTPHGTSRLRRPVPARPGL